MNSIMKQSPLFSFLLTAVTMIVCNPWLQAAETEHHPDAQEQPRMALPALLLGTTPDAPQSIALRQNTVTGTIGNDYIKLYGNGGQARQPEPVRNPTLTRSQTFSSTVFIELNGTILKGTEAETPTVHFYLNGKDVGVATLSNEQSAYSKQVGGVPHSDLQRFTFHLDELDIREMKLVIDSPPIPQSEVYIHRININPEVNLEQNLEVNGLRGATVRFAEPSVQWGGRNGYQLPQGAIPSDVRSVTIDTSLYRTTLQRAPGTPSNPLIVQSGGGMDTLYLLGSQEQYLLAVDENGTLVVAESQGFDQNALVSGMVRLEFADGSFFLPPQSIAGKAVVLATNANGKTMLRALLPQGIGIAARPLVSTKVQEQLTAIETTGVPSALQQQLQNIVTTQPEIVRCVDFATVPALTTLPTIEFKGNSLGKEWLTIESNALPDGAHLLLQDVENVLLSGSRNLFVQSNGVAITIIAGEGNQELRSDSGNDLLIGGAGNDRLFAGAGNDLLFGGTGDDLLDGGAGNDVAYFSGKADEYRITYNAANAITNVVDSVPNRDGSKQLVTIEQLHFTDRIVEVAK